MQPIQYVAYFLSPKNRLVQCSELYENILLQFFEFHGTNAADGLNMHTDYIYYRNMTGPFTASRVCWRYVDNPRLFWMSCIKDCSSSLPKLAVRLFSAPSNSVSSEQAFSVQNALHHKGRANLHPSKVSKLSYVYINHRLYTRSHQNSVPQPIRINELSEEEAVEVEDFLLESLDSLEPENSESLMDSNAIEDKVKDIADIN
jgi:hypothetical protein